MTWPAALTLALAVLGAVLGVINTWAGLRRDRVRFHVMALVADPIYADLGKGPRMIGIEVVNLSGFPVTIVEVGFRSEQEKRLALSVPIMSGDGKFPHRLESRTSMTAYFDASTVSDAAWRRATVAYAHTACQQDVSGSRRQSRRAIAAFLDAERPGAFLPLGTEPIAMHRHRP